MLRQVDNFIRLNPVTNKYEPTLWRREILPSWLTIRDTDATLPIVVPAAPASTPPLTIFQPFSSVNGADAGMGTPFEMRSLVFQDTTDGTDAANFTVYMQEVGEARMFMNNPIHIRTIAGTGQQPAILREPYMFLSQHNVSAKFQNVAGGPSNMRFYCHGAQYFPWSPMMLQYPREKQELLKLLRKWMNRRKYVTPFWLTTDNLQTNGLPNGSVSLGANGTLSVTTKIGDDGHFEAFGLTQKSTGSFSLTITEVKTKQTLMNGVIESTSAIGGSRFPTMFPTSYLIPAGYRVKFTFTDLSGAGNDIFLTMFGRKIYAPISQVQETLRRTAVPTPADAPMQFPTRPIV